jgi:hypothetical protein
MLLRIAAFAICLATPLVAQDRSARFMALMGHLPDGATAHGAQTQPEFVDLEAAGQAVAALRSDGSGDIDERAYRALSSWLAQVPEGEDWTPQVGFARRDVIAIAETGSIEERGRVLMLPAEVMPNIAPALLANGYAERAGAALPTYWRGEEDNAIDIANRQQDDPFAIPLPISSRVVLDGDLLIQSSSWSVLEAMVAAEPDAVLATLAGVIDAPNWGERKLIAATIFSDPMQFAVRPPQAGPATIGVPYWRAMMLADLSDGPNDLTLIVVIYDTKADAETAAQVMQDNLPGQPLFTLQDKVLGDLIGRGGQSMVMGTSPFAAVYAVETDAEIASPLFVNNRGFSVLMRAALTGDLPVLGPLIK